MTAQVVAALMIGEGRILLGLRAPHKRSAPDCWDLIGGHVEPAETPAQALVREVIEELGVTPVDAVPVGRIDFDDSHDGRSTLHFYRVTDWRGAA